MRGIRICYKGLVAVPSNPAVARKREGGNMSTKNYDDQMYDCMFEELAKRQELDEKLYEYLSGQ